VQDVSFTVKEGNIHSVIGPNGAGKTTLFNLITGVYTPSKGEILLNGENVAAMPPDALARRGMSRTFQNLQVCMNMTAIDNVMVGAHLRLNQNLFASMLRLPSVRRADAACRDEAAGLMEFVGVGRHIDDEAGQMSYGALKRLEIARALAAKPKVLLLDEPAAGLNLTEKKNLGELLKRLKGHGMTIFLIEHDISLIEQVSDTITVLNFGKKIAEGEPGYVMRHPDVVAAYLGETADAAA
jgi:branched-chain amino acid transport system ATP-binding protein